MPKMTETQERILKFLKRHRGEFCRLDDIAYCEWRRDETKKAADLLVEWEVVERSDKGHYRLPHPSSPKEIVEEYLADHGFDGLVSDAPCGCFIGDLFPCDEICADCSPGHAHFAYCEENGEKENMIFPGKCGPDCPEFKG